LLKLALNVHLSASNLGWFLESAASSQVQQQTAHNMLVGNKVSVVLRHQNSGWAVMNPKG
jgi:hypothetical protein